MKVVGITTQQEVYIGSNRRNFRINEFLIIEDRAQGDLIGEVVEAQTYNRYIPLSLKGELADSKVLDSLRAIGYQVDDETIYIAKLRLLNEAQYPVETGSDVRIPEFSEVKKLFINSRPEEGLVLGVIKNTDPVAPGMDKNLKNLVYTLEEGKLKAQKDIPYIYNIRSMHQYPHIGVFGGSGSGKSFGLRVLLEELMKLGIPSLVLDPHFEMDFSTQNEATGNHNYDSKFKCLQVGFDIGVKFEDLSRRDLQILLESSADLTDSMINAVDILYKSKDSYMSFQNRLENLLKAQELGSQKAIEGKIEEAKDDLERKQWQIRLSLYEKYANTCPHASVRGILWRLNRLNNEGIFSKDISPIEEGLKLGKLVVIQGSTRILQVFSTYLLNNLYYKRREYRDALYRKASADYFPPFIVVTDEAHNFAPKGFETPSKGILKEISQEGRKYGTFLILATQRPTLLDETITAQLNTKFIFRTVRASDIQTIKEETDIKEEEARRLPYLRTGDVFISEALMGRTIFSRIRAAHTDSPHTENPFDELFEKAQEEDQDLYRIVEENLPILDLLTSLQNIEKQEGKTFSQEEFKEILEHLADKGKIGKKKTPFGVQYIKID